MKTTTISCLLAALCSATHVLADALQASPAATITEAPAAEPTPQLVDDAAEPHLEIRQGAAVQAPAATLNPSQVPIATTQWFESTIGSSTTYVEVPYTQLFSTVPDQLPSPISGEIGYGTLKKAGGATKSKREVEARETGLAGIAGSAFAYAQPVVLVLQNVVVTQYVQPVQEVLILHAVTVSPNVAVGSIFPVGNDTHSSNTTLPSITSTLNGTITNATTSTQASGSLAYNYTSAMGTGTGLYFF